MSTDHKLAAILFADIAGYTGLMQKNEEDALELLNRFKEALEAITPKHQGRIVQYFGDGCLISFDSSSNSVVCAIALQKAFSEIPAVPVRMGLHLGDVVFKNDNVFGDGVNIASRIESLGIPGAILMSKTIRDQIKNKSEFLVVSLGSFDFKNVTEPMEVFALANPGFVVPKRVEMQGKLKNIQKNTGVLKWIAAIALIAVLAFMLWFFTGQKKSAETITEKSIAVLPFTDMSAAKDQEYFSDGLTEELMNLLAKTNGLKVIARTSSFAFKGKNEDVKTISEKLGVDHILEGTVRKAGNQIRITAKLIRASDAKMLWNDTYNRIIDDIFKVQDEIANAVVKKLRVKLLETGKPKESKPEVHNLILQGNYYHEKLDREGVLKSMQFYKQAVALDSTDAKAWAMLAKSYSRAAWQNYIPQQEGYEQARKAVLKGYQIDPNNTDVLLIYAGLKLYSDFEWKEAEELLQKVLELEPANAAALNTLGSLYQATGKWKDAIKETSKELVYDPLRPIVYSNQGANFTYLNQLDKGIDMYRKALEINPQFQRAHMYIGRNYLLQGNPEVAMQEMHKENIPFFKHFGIALVMHAIHNQHAADSLLNSFVSNYQKEWPYLIAELYAFRNEKQKAISWLQKAYEQNDSWLVWIKGDPLLKNIWEHSEYKSILKKMNLP